MQSTLGYALRTETGNPPLSAVIFELLCFLKMQTISKNALKNISDKYNWYLQVKRIFFDQIDETDSWININLEILRMNKEKYIQKKRISS